MRKTILAAALLAAPAAWADGVLGHYFATIGPQDFHNSSGARLTDPCAILQQDRANVHRFGIAQDGDQRDPWFGDRAARTVIGSNCRLLHPSSAYVADFLRQGRTRYVYVQVHGRNGRPTYVMFGEGAG
jgi:hypothetical protein